ncbi:MAG: hypothetical protein BRD48_01950 [Bacteroidetes bacterium QS_9_68_14]|nr:MAG: hypothetical protein BRD48_01950 [Bacteroidetes bacterium QS_9_68_14]
MRRVLYAALALLALLAVVGGALWYFSYGMDATPPARVNVAGLQERAHLSWNGAGVATIRADSTGGRYAALGYAHGTGRPWMVALWRQTAAGRLGEWFGEEMLPLDRLARRLGFADLARRSYAQLPGEQKALLRSYARGMNTALQSKAVQTRSKFALLGETPGRWQPWHALAIERLYAYLAHRPPARDGLPSTAPPGARRFLRTDSTLRRWLHVHDMGRSAAWAARSPQTGTTHLFYRHVYGSSAIPPLQAVLFERPGASNVSALSLPGTPFLVAGRDGPHAWALLPGGTLQLERAAYDTTAAPRHERILGANDSEHLVTVRRSGGALLLEEQPVEEQPVKEQPVKERPAGPAPAPRRDTATAPPPGSLRLGGPRPSPDSAAARTDSLWQVRWAGLRPGSDLASWRALARGEASGGNATFQLLRAGGIVADSSGSFSRFGTPERTVAFEGGLVAGPARWTPFLAEQVQARLRQAARDTTTPGLQLQQWVQADSSAWAGRLAPDMLASVDSLSRTRSGTFTYEERTDIFGQAIRYLRNWNFSYERASIGASIFDTWVAAYHRETGRLPASRGAVDSLATSDSLRALEDRRRFRLLSSAVSRLASRYGDDIEEWRWETVAPDTRHFPGWTDSLSARRLRVLAGTRYAPIEIPGGGHPSTLNHGASPVSLGRPAPAGYEAWLSTDQWQTLHVRRRRFDTNVPFGRYRAQRVAPDPLALRFDGEGAHKTTLVPADSSAPRLFRARF